MKCLSIRQPWLWALLYAGKPVENRTWRTAFRGPILLHAGATMDFQPSHLYEWDGAETWDDIPETHDPLPLGAIVGVANLVGCVPATTYPPGTPWVVHEPGNWCWQLGDRVPLKHPIPYKGALGLFDVPDEIVMAALLPLQEALL